MKASSFSGSCLYSTWKSETESLHGLWLSDAHWTFIYAVVWKISEWKQRPGTAILNVKLICILKKGIVHKIQTLCI